MPTDERRRGPIPVKDNAFIGDPDPASLWNPYVRIAGTWYLVEPSGRTYQSHAEDITEMMVSDPLRVLSPGMDIVEDFRGTPLDDAARITLPTGAWAMLASRGRGSYPIIHFPNRKWRRISPSGSPTLLGSDRVEQLVRQGWYWPVYFGSRTRANAPAPHRTRTANVSVSERLADWEVELLNGDPLLATAAEPSPF